MGMEFTPPEFINNNTPEEIQSRMMNALPEGIDDMLFCRTDRRTFGFAQMRLSYRKPRKDREDMRLMRFIVRSLLQRLFRNLRLRPMWIFGLKI